MGRNQLFQCCATFVWLATATFADAASPPITFNYVTLDYPGAHDTELNGINGGKIVGDWETNGSTLFPNSFVYDGSSFKSIAFPGADLSLGTQAYGISGNVIAGIYWTPDPNIHEHGFLYDGNSYTTIDDPLANSFYANQGGVFGISGNHLVGEYIDSASHGQSFFYDGTTFTTLSPGPASAALGVDGNKVVGYYAGGQFGYLYDGDHYTTIADPSGTHLNEAVGISGNNIVGDYQGEGESASHGFLFDGTSYYTIDIPGSKQTSLRGIEGNTIVGWYLNGTGYHGVIITVPEPSTLALLTLGGVIAFAAKGRQTYFL